MNVVRSALHSTETVCNTCNSVEIEKQSSVCVNSYMRLTEFFIFPTMEYRSRGCPSVLAKLGFLRFERKVSLKTVRHFGENYVLSYFLCVYFN